MPATQLGVAGIVKSNGTLGPNTENFTCERTAVGTYKITFSPEFNIFAAPSPTPIGTSAAPQLSGLSKSGFTVKFLSLVGLLATDTEWVFGATE